MGDDAGGGGRGDGHRWDRLVVKAHAHVAVAGARIRCCFARSLSPE